MRNVRAVIFAVMGLVSAVPVWAEAETDHRAGINLGGFGDGYNLSLTYHYRVCNYVGLGGAVGYWSDGSPLDLMELTNLDEPPYSPYRKRQHRHYAFFVEPSVLLSSPVLHIGSCGLGLTAIPSVRFATTRHGNSSFMENGTLHSVRYRCSNITFGLQCGPTFYAGPFAITAGYMVSSIDVYRDYISRNKYVRHTAQGLFLDVGFYF